MEDIGGEMVQESSYAAGDTDFSGQLTEFANLDPQPDFLFISSGPNEIGTIVKQVRDNGIELSIVGGDGYDTPLLLELAGEAAEGTASSPPTKASTASQSLERPSTPPTKPNTARHRRRSSLRSVTTVSS